MQYQLQRTGNTLSRSALARAKVPANARGAVGYTHHPTTNSVYSPAVIGSLTPYSTQRQAIEYLQRTHGNAFVARQIRQLQSRRGASELLEPTPEPIVMREVATTPGGPDPCFNLLEEIINLLNEVAQRFNDALNDRHNLYRDFRTTPHPEGHGSWEGHKNRFNYDRGRLRHKLAEWDSNDKCKGYRLSREQQAEFDEAKEFAEKEFPSQPAPSLREANKAPSPSTTADPSYREKIARALQDAGVPAWAVAGLVVLVIAALADPEPFTKVALLIGSAAAIAFFVFIGRGNDVPSSAPTAMKPSDRNQQLA